MRRKSKITQEQYLDFVVQLYFGPTEDLLQKCIERGYFDLQRTLHNITEVDPQGKLKQNAITVLYDAIKEVTDLLPPETITQAAYDNWHKQICEKIDLVYEGVRTKKDTKMFYIGQAQKWVNMTFKYIFALQALPGGDYLNDLKIDYLYEFCHVPLDNAVLTKLAEKGFKYDFFWSRIDDYDQYLEYQHWIRHHFPNKVPLDAEFHLWDARTTT